jgi:predicted DNA-binding transcriptional regulator AlpA
MPRNLSKNNSLHEELTINNPNPRDKILDADAVMMRLNYRDRSAFWDSVHRNHIPHIRISCRKILFEESTLNDWIDSRRVGAASKKR